jgi:hypothetical protein
VKYYNSDVYDIGTPKYSTVSDIYDALYELVQSEEMGVINQMRNDASDVSWEGQDYYYTDKGNRLKERWDELDDYGNNTYLFYIAIDMLDENEIHDTVVEALRNSSLSKKIGFKNMFVKEILHGDKTDYDAIIEDFEGLVYDLSRYDGMSMNIALYKALEAHDRHTKGVYTYPMLSHAVYAKICKLDVGEYKQLIIECRELLTAYEDFMFGLKANQALYEEQKKLYEARLAALEAAYTEKARLLYSVAEQYGLAEKLVGALGSSAQPAALPDAIIEITEG